MSKRTKSAFVIDVAEEFLRTKLPREPKTRAAYSGILVGSERGTKKPLGQPFAVYFHNRRFDSLEPDEVAIWFAQRVNQGALATKNRISKNSRSFLHWARELGYCTHDLASAISVFPSSGPRVDWLEWNDVHNLIATIPEYRLRVAATWLFFTGCRVSEAISARHHDLRHRSESGFWQWTIPDSKTHIPRTVWLPTSLGGLIEETRALNRPKPDWPILWDCAGRGFGRKENAATHISRDTIAGALERARDAIDLPFKVTPHVAKHTYCSNWIRERGDGEIEMEKLSRQVGTSVAELRKTYVHIHLTDADWMHLGTFGGRS